MPLGLQNAYMAEGVQSALRQRIADQIAEEERQRRALIDQRQLAQDDERLAQGREALMQRQQPAAPERPLVINGKLVKPTGEVLGDFSTPPEPEKPLVINGRLVKPTGELIGDFSTPPADPEAAYSDWQRKQDYNEQQIRTRPHRDPVPIVIQTPTGPQIVDRGNATTRPVTDQSGATIPPTPTGAQRTRAADAEVALETLGRMKESYQPKYVGPIAGRARSLGQKLPGVPADPGFGRFQANTAAFRNQTIKAITGAQMSEREADRIRQQIPEENDKPEVWTEKARATEENLKDIGEAMALGTTVDDIKARKGGASAAPKRKRYDMNGKLLP